MYDALLLLFFFRQYWSWFWAGSICRHCLWKQWKCQCLCHFQCDSEWKPHCCCHTANTGCFSTWLVFMTDFLYHIPIIISSHWVRCLFKRSLCYFLSLPSSDHRGMSLSKQYTSCWFPILSWHTDHACIALATGFGQTGQLHIYIHRHWISFTLKSWAQSLHCSMREVTSINHSL